MRPIFFVICGNMEEFLDYTRNRDWNLYDYRYVHDRTSLMGHNDPHGCFCGSWRQREDIQEIIMELIVRTLPGNRNNQTLKDLLYGTF